MEGYGATLNYNELVEAGLDDMYVEFKDNGVFVMGDSVDITYGIYDLETLTITDTTNATFSFVFDGDSVIIEIDELIVTFVR